MLCCITDEISTCQRDLTCKLFKRRSFRRKTIQQLGKVGPFHVTHVIHSSDNDSGSESEEEVKPEPLPKLVDFYNRKGQYIVSSKHMDEYLKLLDVTVKGTGKKLKGITQRTVPTKNVESVVFKDVTEGVESVTNENVTQQDFNHVTDKCSHDTSSEDASEDSMLLSDDEMDAYFSDNSDIP